MAPLRSLARDERGGLLILAIPMTALSIGCLWYLASARDAIVHRERLQDAADELAWQSALLHARGMNATVTANLALSALSAIPAALDTLEQVGAASQAATHDGQALLDATHLGQQQLLPGVQAAWQIVAESQRAVAAATPVLAATLAAAGEHDGITGLSVSHALLSPDDRAALEASAHAPWALTSRAEPPPQSIQQPMAAQLPLESMPQRVLCQEHAARIPEPLALGARLLPPARDVHARDLTTRLGWPLDGSLFTLTCELPGVPSAATERATRGSAGLLPLSAASNGNALLQVWSVAGSASPPRAQVDERGLSVALGRTITLHPSTRAVAQAEYYFDCAGAWADCAADAAFQPRWAARMRRYERPDGADPAARDARVAEAFARAAAALTSESGGTLRATHTDIGSSTPLELVSELFTDLSGGAGRYIH